MSAPIRVLALHAHPDDVEFQCAGTLTLLREAGCAVTIATMTPGDCGSAEHDAEAISAIRREEARAAAALIGAEYTCLEFRDLAIFNDDESRRRVTETLRRAQPAIILTAPPADYIADHEMTSLLVRDACFAAPCPNYTTRQWDPAPPLAKIPHLYFVDPVEGSDREGRPVRGRFPRRRLPRFRDQAADARLSRQPAQLAASPARHRRVSRRCRSSGGPAEATEIGVAQAESFRQYRGHPYPQDNLLLQLLGQDGRGKPIEGDLDEPAVGPIESSRHSRPA